MYLCVVLSKISVLTTLMFQSGSQQCPGGRCTNSRIGPTGTILNEVIFVESAGCDNDR